MIVVDTSALIAILKNEAEADACQRKLETEDTLLIGASTLTEALIVAGQRGYTMQLEQLVAEVGIQCVVVTEQDARAAAAAYASWGKGVHPAGLNFGDCFAYALAKANNCPLLFVGDDFSRTDIASAL